MKEKGIAVLCVLKKDKMNIEAPIEKRIRNLKRLIFKQNVETLSTTKPLIHSGKIYITLIGTQGILTTGSAHACKILETVSL